MKNFITKYDMLEEYMVSARDAYVNLVQMRNVVIKQFRHQELFPKIEEISRPYIPAELKFKTSAFNYEKDWLQMYYPNRERIHLEWLLENYDRPGFFCPSSGRIPFYFHIEMADNKRNTLVSYMMDYIAKQQNGAFEEANNSWGWSDKNTNKTLDIELSKTYNPKCCGLLRVEPLQEITAKSIEQWLPELLQTPPVQLLLKLLVDNNFWSRPEIQELIG